MKFRERSALRVVGIFATWSFLFLNIAVWEGLYFLHTVIHLPAELLNYELSVWPVLIDIVILMVNVVWTIQQRQMSDDILLISKSQADTMRLLVAMNEAQRDEIHDIADDVEDIRDAVIHEEKGDTDDRH